MCGRYYVEVDDETAVEMRRIIENIGKKETAAAYKTGEIYPTNVAPIIVGESGKRDYTTMSWGFPNYRNKGVIINARGETAAEKRMFSKSLTERRCVIPVSGFFEWQKKDATKAKNKFLFRSDGDSIMYMAGIFNNFQDENKFVILTRDANVSIADIHDRMPVILYKQEIDNWLHDNNFVLFVLNRDNIKLRRELV